MFIPVMVFGVLLYFSTLSIKFQGLVKKGNQVYFTITHQRLFNLYQEKSIHVPYGIDIGIKKKLGEWIRRSDGRVRQQMDYFLFMETKEARQYPIMYFGESLYDKLLQEFGKLDKALSGKDSLKKKNDPKFARILTGGRELERDMDSDFAIKEKISLIKAFIREGKNNEQKKFSVTIYFYEIMEILGSLLFLIIPGIGLWFQMRKKK